MAYNDVTVYVEDTAGDQGAPPPGAAWWLSPDVDIPAHSGTAFQGTNQVQIRVHAHDEPFLQELAIAEVYVGKPGFVLSPTTGTKRIDPGNLKFRPPTSPGPEPVADIAGGTLTFPWTPSGAAADIDGPGHRCLIVRAFPESLTPPTDPFDIAAEQHEAQHNIEVLTTTKLAGDMAHGGAGTPGDPRKRERDTGMWWEELVTMAANPKGRRIVAWAFDPAPGERLSRGLRSQLKKAGLRGFSDQPPAETSLETPDGNGEPLEIQRLLKDGQLIEQGGMGKGLWKSDRLLNAAILDLSTEELSRVIFRFDLSNLKERTAVVLHGAQWSDSGKPEGGMTIVALAPTGE
jgi:hypothetical protein